MTRSNQFDSFRAAITGTVCRGVIAQAYEHHGALVTQVTVLYFGFDEGRWARFGIDSGEFHWRETNGIEQIESAEGHSYPLWDFGVTTPIIGRRVREVTITQSAPGVATLRIYFAEGGALAMINADDESRVEYTKASE